MRTHPNVISFLSTSAGQLNSTQLKTSGSPFFFSRQSPIISFYYFILFWFKFNFLLADILGRKHTCFWRCYWMFMSNTQTIRLFIYLFDVLHVNNTFQKQTFHWSSVHVRTNCQVYCFRISMPHASGEYKNYTAYELTQAAVGMAVVSSYTNSCPFL